MVAAVATDGWSVENPPTFIPQAFNAQGRQMSGTLCRDAVRRSVAVEDVADIRYASISITTSADNPRRECNAPYPGMNPETQRIALETSRSFMPRFEFRQAPASSTGSVAATVVEAAQPVLPRASSAIPARRNWPRVSPPSWWHRGWLRDGGWSDKGSAGSTWRRTNSDGSPGAGVLEVASTGKRRIRRGFQPDTARAVGADHAHTRIAWRAGVLCGAAFGQDLLDCIDPDVLHGLLLPNPNDQQVNVNTVVPAELSALRMPAQFSWIGSMERTLGRVDATTMATTVTAAYRTMLAPAAVRPLAASALDSGGWQLTNSPLSQNAFVAANALVTQTFCREQQQLSLNAGTIDGVTYVMFAISRGAASNICNSRRNSPAFISPEMDGYAPTLELPDPGGSTQLRMQNGSTGGGNTSRTYRTSFEFKDSVDNVARHFARQMTAQGWTSDGSWSGASTAGSAWVKQVAPGATVQGTLQVIAVEQGRFAVSLHLVKAE